MKAIAMKATQQDWDSVKDLVKRSIEISDFNDVPYLVTNLRDDLGLVSNSVECNRWGRTVYETFDRAIFLDALDIVEQKIWNGSELQYMLNNEWFDFDDNTRIRLKPINPEVKQLQELADKLGYKIQKL